MKDKMLEDILSLNGSLEALDVEDIEETISPCMRDKEFV
jgi:Asp-tRNA(Asn)/Glu-tRNA(Gln) amidotransferase C subunit